MNILLKSLPVLIYLSATLLAEPPILLEQSVPVATTASGYPQTISKKEYKRQGRIVARLSQVEYSIGIQTVLEFRVGEDCWIEFNLDSAVTTGRTNGDVLFLRSKDSIMVVSSRREYFETFFLKERKFADGDTRAAMIAAGQNMEKQIKSSAE